MILEPHESDASPAAQQQRIDAIVAAGPGGTFAVAGVAVALVLAMWLAFYLFVFVARGGA